ncbi:MAG: hypothetical protein KDB23_30570, partial [Planctomycetales bacterium]|nr:hypothetical protein [Planctomycetales bacterium]
IVANTGGARTTLSAFAGVGNGNPLETDVAVLDISNTDSWNIEINDVGTSGVVIRQIQQEASNGLVSVVAAGTINVNDADAPAAGITSKAGSVTLDANGTSPNILLRWSIVTEGGAVILDSAGTVTMTGTGDIYTNSGTSSSGANVTISAVNDIWMADDGSAVAEIESGDGTIALTSTSGNIRLGELTSTKLSVNGTAIIITATAGAIVDEDAGTTPDLIAISGTVSLSAANGIGSSNAIETTAGEIEFANAAGTVAINEQDNVSISGSSGGGIDVVVTTANALLTIKNVSGTDLASSTGNITLTADDLEIPGTVNVVTGNMTIAPLTPSQVILLGSNSTTAGGQLGLTDVELNRLHVAGVLTIGSAQSGEIQLTASIDLVSTPEDVTDLHLITSGAIVDSDGASDPTLLTVKNLTLTAASIGNSGDADIDIKVDTLAANTSGTQFIAENDGVTLRGVIAAAFNLVSGGPITDDANASTTVTGNANLAGTSITLGDTATDTFNAGSITVNSTGAVAISEDSATELTGTNTAASLNLDSTGAITDDANASTTVTGNADLAGTSITLGDTATDTFNAGSITVNS